MLALNRFASAQKEYSKSVHPRLFFCPQQLDELAQQAQAGNGKRILDAMIQSVDSFLDNVGADDSRRLLPKLFEIALVGKLGGHEPALDAALKALEASPNILRRPESWEDFSAIPYEAFLAYDLLHGELSPRAAAAFRACTIENVIETWHEQFERDPFIAPGMNKSLMRCKAMLIAALAFQGDPDVPDFEPLLQNCARFMAGYCRTGLGLDGYPEEDTGYGTAYLAIATELGELLFRSGHFNMFRNEHWLRSGRAMLHFVQPWGETFAITGDYGDYTADLTLPNMCLARMAHETNDPTLLWLAGTLTAPGKKHVKLSNGLRVLPHYSSLFYLDVLEKMKLVHPGKAGVPTSFRERSRGIVSARSSWDARATHAIFDGSERRGSVMGHWHASAGHFTITALGEYFSIDTGRYNCDYDQHSVMVVDGQIPYSSDGQWKTSDYMGRLLDFTPGEICDTAVTDASHMSGCYWAFRTMGLVKGEEISPYVWTVDDVNQDNDFHEFWWTMQTALDNRIEIRGEEATIIGHRHGNMLDVGFVYPAPEEYPKPHTLSLESSACRTSTHAAAHYPMGDIARQIISHQPVQWSLLVRPRLVATLAGYNGKLMSVMVPRSKGRRPTRFERLKSCPNSLAMKVHFPKVSDTLIYAYEHGFLEADDIVAEGDFVLVRKRKRDQKVLAWSMRNGTSLKVGGKTLS